MNFSHASISLIFDIAVLLFFAYAIYVGLRKKMLYQAISALLFIIAIAFFGYITAGISRYIRSHIASISHISHYIFALLFVAGLLGANYITGIITGKKKQSKKTPARLLSIAASIIKYAYILSILFLYYAHFLYQTESQYRGGAVYQFVKTLASRTIPTLSFL